MVRCISQTKAGYRCRRQVGYGGNNCQQHSNSQPDRYKTRSGNSAKSYRQITSKLQYDDEKNYPPNAYLQPRTVKPSKTYKEYFGWLKSEGKFFVGFTEDGKRFGTMFTTRENANTELKRLKRIGKSRASIGIPKKSKLTLLINRGLEGSLYRLKR